LSVAGAGLLFYPRIARIDTNSSFLGANSRNPRTAFRHAIAKAGDSRELVCIPVPLFLNYPDATQNISNSFRRTRVRPQ
jgi:hypothetical protein